MFYFIRKKARTHQHLSKQYNIFIRCILESSKHWLWACFWVWGDMAGIRYCRTNIRPTKQVRKHIQCVQWSDFWTAVHSECDLSCLSNQSYQADTCGLTWHYSENKYEIWHYSIYSLNHWKNWLQCNMNSEIIKKNVKHQFLLLNIYIWLLWSNKCDHAI